MLFQGQDRMFQVKYQLEYYFGPVNYPTDRYLKSCEDKEGWIFIDEIQGWYKMRNIGMMDAEIVSAMKNSTVVEVSADSMKLRRKQALVNDQITFLGFDKEGIRNLTPA